MTDHIDALAQKAARETLEKAARLCGNHFSVNYDSRERLQRDIRGLTDESVPTIAAAIREGVEEAEKEHEAMRGAAGEWLSRAEKSEKEVERLRTERRHDLWDLQERLPTESMIGVLSGWTRAVVETIVRYVTDLRARVAELEKERDHERAERENEMLLRSRVHDQLQTAEARVAKLEQDIANHRRDLWMGHGHEAPYGDDGEMQCGHAPHPCDFKRDPFPYLVNHICAVRFKTEHELAAAQSRILALEGALRALGRERQFAGELCWCRTVAGVYCVGQPECDAAQAALAPQPQASGGEGND